MFYVLFSYTVMQSILQYRRIGHAVERQIQRDQEKARALSAYTQQHGIHGGGDMSEKPRDTLDHQPLEATESPRDEEAFTESLGDAEEEDVMEDSYPPETDLNLSKMQTHRTHYSERTALGYSMTGINARARKTNESEQGHVFVVDWEGPNDPLKPHNWPMALRVRATVIVALVAVAGTAASSIDAAVLPQYSEYWHVSEVAGTLATALYLMGFAIGSQFAGPFSETLGRNIIYIITMFIYMLFLMACALAPTFGGHITLRFLAGFFGSTPLTVGGGTIADLWNPLEKTFGFPIYAFIGFSGPLFGPVIGSYIGPSGIGWRWCEWLMLVLGGIVTVIIVLAQPETYAPLLLSWKAKHFRELTGDDRYRSPLEVRRTTFMTRLKIALYRPFVMIWTEPIILLMALYLTILYIVLFTFFVGFEFIFTDIYDISQGLTNIIWLAVAVGFCPVWLTVHIIYKWTVKDMQEQSKITGEPVSAPRPETRLWFAILGGAFALPISLFWMGWTDFKSVSIWSPIIASALFGYGTITIFIAAYLYIIDSYSVYAASALSFVTVTRYMAAGGMTIVGVPFYKNLGPRWTLTVLGCISALMAPVPFILYKYGAKIRTKSAYAVHQE